MSSVVLDSSLSFHDLVHRVNDDDIEMSDDGHSVESEHRQSSTMLHTGDLLEILVKDKHDLFSQDDTIEYMRRVSVITSFLSLMEIAPAKAFYLMKEASQEPNSQQCRDYALFKQIFSDMQQLREVKYVLAENSRKHTSSSNHQSVIGSSSQLDSLQWMFTFFNMYSVPFHRKNTDSNVEEDETVLYLRERTSNGLGDVAAVVLVQKPTLKQRETEQSSDIIRSILKELKSNDSKTHLGMVINCNSLRMYVIDADTTRNESANAKAVRSVSIAQRNFDLSNVSDFAELITILELYLTLYLNVNSVMKQISQKNEQQEEIIQEEEDMESSPVPRTYPEFPERDHFHIDRFNTTLSYLNIPSQFSDMFGSVPINSDGYQVCVKKRSHFCNWERKVLNKLKSHPYIIKELDVDLSVQHDTTLLFEHVRPLNKRFFSLIPTDGQGNYMVLTQQLLNTRFEILRQFIKQALHSLVYCHNNGIAHNNILSRGGTFFLDEQYKLKLMGFEHAVVSDDHHLRFRDMRHLAVVFAELMFNVQFDITGDDETTDWSALWDEIQVHLDKHQDIVHRCPHTSTSDKLLFTINSKTRKHMYDLLKQMFHTDSSDYYHTYMYHSYVGMASSVYKEKSKQKLREKTMHMLNGSKSNNNSPRQSGAQPSLDHRSLVDKWTSLRAPSQKEDSSYGSSRSSTLTVQE